MIKIVRAMTELYSSGEDVELHDQLSTHRRHQRRRTVCPQGLSTRASPVPQTPCSPAAVVGRSRCVEGTEGRVVGVRRSGVCRPPPVARRNRRRHVRRTGRLSVRELLHLNNPDPNLRYLYLDPLEGI